MEKQQFASRDLTAGQLNAIVKKLGGHEAALKFLRGELSVSEPTRNWREKDGVIYFSVTSDGTTGEEWIARLEGKGFRVAEDSKSVLRSEDFKPTTGITTEVAVLKGMLFENNERITKNIRKVAGDRKLETPNAEIACLIREMFTDEEIKAMGLTWIIVMHEPIENTNGVPCLLRVFRGVGGLWLYPHRGEPDERYPRGSGGFAFAVSQVGTQN